jgi:signal transduction histidine kinase
MTLLLSLLLLVLGAFTIILLRRLSQARKALTQTSSPPMPRGTNAAQREALRLGRILAAMPDGVMVVEDHEVVYANPATARILGGDPARIVPTIQASPLPAIVITVHHPAYREVRCTRTTLESGSLLVVIRDVTEARRLDQMRQDFVANASHELKTPVAAIRATAETLQSAIQDDADSARRFVETLFKEASRLSELVQDLLDLTRLDHTAAAADEVCLADVVINEVLETFASRAGESGIELNTQLASNVQVPVRDNDFALAVRNLVDNALRHTPPNGRIEIILESEPSRTRVHVRDSGEGIPAKDLPRIFERFYRVDRARSRETGGTGLGLAIVKHVAEAAGGSVQASSTFGSGATFTMTLPPVN